jgi:type IV pilus assembly protein PilB
MTTPHFASPAPGANREPAFLSSPDWRQRAAELHLPCVAETEPLEAAPEALALVTLDWAQRHQAVPVRLSEAGVLIVCADPAQLPALDALSHRIGRRVEPWVASPERVRRALAIAAGSPAVRTGDEGGADDAPVVECVERLLAQAVHRRASDVHVEPLAAALRVRYRVDGVLQEGESLGPDWHAAVVSRLKIMARLSIAEKRVPQDGRMRVPVAGRELDLRVSIMPTVHGESVVLRLLDRMTRIPSLAELGFDEEAQGHLGRWFAAPDGLVLVTGPTGSGKTTTLYSGLQQLNDAGRKIITVEDPVEYELAGVNQVPVRSELGMTFASALRAMLRQSPNLVMVGEIRDRETAEIAVQAALTGHMVLSTLHTNDAHGALARLIDMGVKPFLVASALRAVLAQRLVRRVCDRCAGPDAHVRRWWPHAEWPRAVSTSWRRGVGCVACHGTGYHGRLAIYEILDIDETVRSAVQNGVSSSVLRAQSHARGWRSLRDCGLEVASAGLTTLEEVVSVTAGDSL